MTTETSTPLEPGRDGEAAAASLVRELVGRITRIELGVAGVIGTILLVLVLLEPDILEAPFENERTILFTLGGTVLAAIGLAAMLWLRVPPMVRVVVLVVPFAIVNWWLLSPYFIDDVVDEDFSTSIAEQLTTGASTGDPTTGTATSATPGAEAQPTTGVGQEPADVGPDGNEPTAPPPPTAPVLLGAGGFVGLAGHSGTGDAGIFENPDGSLVLRFENFDIQNGPDLEVYLVPGAGQTTLADGTTHLGELKGNVGDQNYEFPPGTVLPPGEYTVLVWCDAFGVEFVGATIAI